MHATLIPKAYVLVHRKWLMPRIAKRLFSQTQKTMLIQNLGLNSKKSMRRSEKRQAWMRSKPKMGSKVIIITLEVYQFIPVLYLVNKPYDIKEFPSPCPRKSFPVSCTVPKRPPTLQAFRTMEGQQRHNFL